MKNVARRFVRLAFMLDYNQKVQIGIDLIRQCVRKDRRAQKELYTLLMPYLNTVVSRYLFEQSHRQDTLQEAFIAIFKGIEGFDASKASFKTWAVRITIHCSIKQNARNKAAMVIPLTDAMEGYLPCDQIDKWSDEAIIAFLKRMPFELYSVFNLYCIEGFDHNEIGDMLNIRPELSRQRLTRARQWLVKHSKGSGIELLENFVTGRAK